MGELKIGVAFEDDYPVSLFAINRPQIIDRFPLALFDGSRDKLGQQSSDYMQQENMHLHIIPWQEVDAANVSTLY